MSKKETDPKKKEAKDADKKIAKKKEDPKDKKQADPKGSTDSIPHESSANLKYKINNPNDYMPIAYILKSFPNDTNQKTITSSIPPSSAVSYEKIALYLDTQASNKEKAAFYIYCWITQTIKFDADLHKKKGKKIISADTAFKSKRTIAYGYCDLFNKMVSKIGIKCATIPGELKHLVSDSKEESKEEHKHYWNAINIHNEWYFIDCALGSKNTIEEQAQNVTESSYWVILPKELIQTHFPDDPQWQLMDTPISLKEFEDQPRVSMAYFKFRMKVEPEVQGVVDVNKKHSFTLQCTPYTEIAWKLDGIENAKQMDMMRLLAVDNKFASSSEVVANFQKTSYEITIDFPRAGKFFLVIFGRDKSNTSDMFTGCAMIEFNNKPS